MAVIRLCLLAALLFCAVRLAAATDSASDISGRLDLSTWNFESHGPAGLGGRWQFYPGVLVGPVFSDSSPATVSAGSVDIPGVWTEAKVPRFGIGTYRIQIRLPPDIPGVLSLDVSAIPCAYRVYADGVLLGEVGRVATLENGYQAEEREVIFQLGSQSGTLDLCIQVANFNDKFGGIPLSPRLGLSADIESGQELRNMLQMASSATILVLGFYLLCFAIFTRRGLASLYIGCFAILMGLHFLFLGSHITNIFFPHVDWEFSQKPAYVSYYLGLALFVQYLNSSFPGEKNEKFSLIIWIISGLLTLSVIFLPLHVFQDAVIVYHVVLFASIIYCGTILAHAIRLRRMGARLFLLSYVLVYSAAIIDIVHSVATRGESHFSEPAVFVALFIQSVLLSWRFNADFERSQALSSELKRLLERQDQVQEDLEKTVVDRTLDLRRALDQANAANKAKSDFLANVSHEIRTPLNGIIGFAEMMRDADAPDVLDRNVDLLLSEADRLLRLIDQLLDISKIEANKLVLESHPFDIHEMFRTITVTMQLRCQALGLRYYMNLDDELPRYLKGDPLRLRQILDNLLANALKFTEQGSIVLSVRVSTATEAMIELECLIQDTGIGIPPDRQESIFESFEQADTSTTRLYGGSGLGTSIAKRLVELMDGKIWLNSEPGEGSLFGFRVRLSRTEAGQEEVERVPDHRSEARWINAPVAILAEDYEVNAEITTRHLNRAGWIVHLARNGREAVDLFQKEQVDIVLLDLQMPVMDGYEAARKIRDLKQRPVPILAISANAFAEDHEKCRKAGMDGLIPKPVRRPELLETIARFVPPGSYVETEVAAFGSQGVGKYSNILKDLEGDLISLLGLIKGFLEACLHDLPLMRSALHAGDAETLHRLAHAIKGGALNLGATRISTIAAELEQTAKQGHFDLAPQRLSRLVEEVYRLKEAMREAREDPENEVF